MERRTRVYPARQPNSGWLSTFILLVAAAVLFSGMIHRGDGDGLLIQKSSAPTPIPMDEVFDETQLQKEMTLPSSQWYALQMGAFEDEAAAEALAAQYVARGAGGYVWCDSRYRVLAAVYPLKEDAQLVRQQLETQHDIDTYLYQIDLPALQLRLNGMRGQLDILEAAFIHADDLLKRMQLLSVAMDRREMSAQEAREQLDGLAEQIQLVDLRLKQRFVSPRHEMVDGMIRCFDSYLTFCTQQTSTESAVSLGAALKHQTLSILDDLKQIYTALQHT